MIERIDSEWTRKLAWRVLCAVRDDQHLLRMIETRGQSIDTQDHCIAGAAIESDQKWAWAALGFLRWLLAEWSRGSEGTAEASDG